MRKQKVTFELDKELNQADVDELIYLLKDAGAENIEIDWDDGCIKNKVIKSFTTLSKEEIEDGGYTIG